MNKGFFFLSIHDYKWLICVNFECPTEYVGIIYQIEHYTPLKGIVDEFLHLAGDGMSPLFY